jgi:hypothetical protein
MTYTVELSIEYPDGITKKDKMQEVPESSLEAIREQTRKMCPAGATYAMKVTRES